MSNYSKTRDSWGSISYDSRRKVGRIRYWAETGDGYRRCSKTVRGTRREVEQARAELMLAHGQDTPCPTVAQVWARWMLPDLERRCEQGDLSPSTMNVYRSVYGKHVSERWASVPCDMVRPLDVQQWLLDGKTHAQASIASTVLSMLLDYAVRFECVSSNVMRARYTMPSKSTTRSQDKGVWTLREVGLLWEMVYGSAIEPAFLVGAFGGCRVGESLAPTGVDVKRREVSGVTLAVVTIDKQVQNRGGVTHRLKTSSSRRQVAIAGKAAERLLSIADERGVDYLSSNGVGGTLTQHVLNKRWSRLVVPDSYHPFRNLRNSWQTWMRWELGVPPWLIEPMMGHVGEGVTGAYYDRPQADVFCETVAKVYAESRYDASWNVSAWSVRDK